MSLEDFFIQDSTLELLCSNLIAVLIQQFDSAMHDRRFSPNAITFVLTALNSFVGAYPQSRFTYIILQQTAPYLYFLVYLVPSVHRIDAQMLDKAKVLWASHSVYLPNDKRAGILWPLKDTARKLLLDTSALPT